MKADLQKKVAHKKEYGEIYLREITTESLSGR